jgi:hypothetical protein
LVLTCSKEKCASDDEVRTFYHLSQGSEFVPYCALKLLKSRGTGKPFTESFEYYGLIPDPIRDSHNKLGLPIGVTTDNTPLQMIGFNCAACHVRKIGSEAPIMGAPSRFDIRGFYNHLIPPLEVLLKDRKQLVRLVGCMLADKLNLPGLPKVEGLDAAETDELLALQKAIGEVEPSPSVDGGELDGGVVDGETVEDAPAILSREIGAELEEHATVEDAERLAAAPPNLRPPARTEIERSRFGSRLFGKLPPSRKETIVSRLLSRYRTTASLIRARMESIKIVSAVGAIEEFTHPGRGRVDAFMTAVNLMRPRANLPMTSPVAYPPLFAQEGSAWRHYDDNTNSRMQRNMGQGIGVGGVFAYDSKTDPPTFQGSSLKPRELFQLEKIAARIVPPKWPFAAPDEALVAKGRTVYDEQCARCHEPKDGRMPDAPPQSQTNTDPWRLENFNRLALGVPVIEVLRTTLADLESKAGEYRDKDPRWQQRPRYGVRTLRGVWATAPYLHNDSVPTLADLLKPPGERPPTFAVDDTKYDTEKVGVMLSPAGWTFDTTKDGNRNTGHEWGTTLHSDQKQALLAYLKLL